MRLPESRRAVSVLCLGLTLALACGGNPTRPPGGEPPGNLSRADSIASYWMQVLGDSLANLPQGAEPDSALRRVRYPDIRHGMELALQESASSRLAQLGSGLLDVIEINYDPELWGMIDSLIAYGDRQHPPMPPPRRYPSGGLYLRRGSPILGNQFTLLATAPRDLMRRSLAGVPGNLSIKRAQELIERLVIPALGNSLRHLELAEANGGPRMVLVIRHDAQTDSVEIDQGEVQFFRASLLAARAGLEMLTAYDLDLPGPDGTYGWVDALREIDDQPSSCGFVEPYAGYMRLVNLNRWQEKEALQDSVALEILRYNVQQRPNFLRKRGAQLQAAYQDLVAMRNEIEAAVTSIRGEGDPQENDVIKISHLTDLDHDIQTGRNRPRFATNFTTIEDVLHWVQTVLTQTYHIQEDGTNGTIELDVNLAAFFNNAPDDWRTVLPYYRFKPANGWLTRQTATSWGYDVSPGSPYSYQDCSTGNEQSRTDIVRVEFRDIQVDFDPIELLDAPNGNPIDLRQEVIPYFPDYKLGGVFPNADRNTWLQVANAAGWRKPGSLVSR